MRLPTTLAALALALAAAPAAAQEALTDPEVLALHDRLLTLDTHVDIGSGYGTDRLDPGVLNRAQVDLPSMRVGGLDAGFFVVYTPQGPLDEAGHAEAFEAAEEGYRGITRMLRAYSDRIALATSADEVERLVGEGMLVALIGIENAYPLGTTEEEVAERVAMWAERGARYASLTHFGHNQFSGSSNPRDDLNDVAEDIGLSDLGRTLVTALNDHGIMVDVSHVGRDSMMEALELSRAPVIATHSGAAGFYENARNLTDAQLEAIRDVGGVAQMVAFRAYLAEVDPAITEAQGALRERLALNTGADFRAATPETLAEYSRELRRIRSENADVTLAQFVDHIDHAVEVAGIDHVGLSGDFDGGGGVAGWDGAEDSPNVTAELMARGYAEEDIAKLWGGNALRVLRAAEEAAR